ncbi:hypothetical protein PFLG_00086 [Plasmodium falciparum RAJ116]|uniref:Rifin n=1 Tax=Plasmodium falciparum RAJ116 TaxID=580058 RepID=A0A0L0CRQ9_PLAFA|nr:hypothetical protein PFLG_00086 [Plasmodium falciparum RAJ116]
MPGFGTIGGTALYALNQLKPAVFKAAIEAAIAKSAAEISAAAKAAGNARGMEIVIGALKEKGIAEYCPEIFNSFVSTNRYAEVANISGDIIKKHGEICAIKTFGENSMCTQFDTKLGAGIPGVNDSGPPPKVAIRNALNRLFGEAEKTAEAAEAAKNAKLTADLTAEKTVLLEAEFNSSITSIYAPIIAIVVIVLIMVIIYLILRYRRKKKMKKKLQYIKLLEE